MPRVCRRGAYARDSDSDPVGRKVTSVNCAGPALWHCETGRQLCSLVAAGGIELRLRQTLNRTQIGALEARPVEVNPRERCTGHSRTLEFRTWGDCTCQVGAGEIGVAEAVTHKFTFGQIRSRKVRSLETDANELRLHQLGVLQDRAFEAGAVSKSLLEFSA